MANRGVIGVVVASIAVVGFSFGEEPVGRFSRLEPGGMPAAWEPLRFSRVPDDTRYMLVETDEGVVLRAESEGAASALLRRVRIDPARHPILRWAWKTGAECFAGDWRREEADDFPLRLFVIFDRSRNPLSLLRRWGGGFPGDAVVYVAGPSPVGADPSSHLTDRIKVVPLERGAGDEWVHLRRDVRADYLELFGREPRPIVGVAVMTDTDNSRTACTSYFGDIAFSATATVQTASSFDHEHAAWTALLARHVEVDGGMGRVDYAAIREDRAALDDYLDDLSAVSQDDYDGWSEAERLAFLINAYNAFTVELIVDHYPLTSIEDLGGWFSSPWKRRFFSLLGDDRHLDWIEHETIRREFDEPRIHFAVNCAARGCPPLRDEAYRASTLDAQLEESTVRFLRDGRRNRFVTDGTRPVVELSRVMDWYRDDFERGGRTLRDFVAARVGGDPAVAASIRDPRTRLRFLDYDWSLNDR